MLRVYTSSSGKTPLSEVLRDTPSDGPHPPMPPKAPKASKGLEDSEIKM
jgi:hypothetical protein